MKSKISCLVAIVGLFMLVATLLVAGEPATDEIGRAVLVTCIKEDDGYAVSIAIRTDGNGTLTAEIIDGTSSEQKYTSLTSIRQEAEGIVIDWEDGENTPSTLTIPSAHIVEVCSN